MTTSTPTIYEEVLKVMQLNTGPMSVNAIRRGTASGREVKSLLAALVKAEHRYSPIVRRGHDSYELTDWARTELAHGKTPFNPMNGSSALASVPVPADQKKQIVEALVEIISCDLEDIVETDVIHPMAVIQALGAKHYELVKNFRPTDLLDALELAYSKAFQKTSGSKFYWPHFGSLPNKVSNNPYREIIGKDRDFMVEILQDYHNYPRHGALTFVPETLDRMAQLFRKDMRIYVGDLGEIITVKHVVALGNECTKDQKGHIYCLGNATEEARNKAKELGIELLDTDKASEVLQQALLQRLVNDMEAEYQARPTLKS